MFLAEVVEEIGKMAVIQLQGFVRRTGAVVEQLAPARFGCLVFCPMNNEQRQSDARELLLEPLVRTNQFSNRLGRLRLVRDERIAVHGGHDLRIAREVLILETQHVGMGRNVTESLQHYERKIRRGCLKGEALADQAGERRLMIERIQAGKDPTRAMPEQGHWKVRGSG